MSHSTTHGFSAPVTAGGKHALYGPPPWRFEGWTSSSVLRFDPAHVADLIPEPLKLVGEPVCRLSLHDIICDYGFGRAFTQENPDQVNFHEAIVGFLVEHDGLRGQWCPYSWCSTDAEFAGGREYYGWPQKMGEMKQTRRPLKGWEVGDTVTSLVTRGRRAVFDMTVKLERQGDIEAVGQPMFPDQSQAGNYFTETALPHPDNPPAVIRRMVATQMQDLWVGGMWSGPATVNIVAPELDFLADAEVIGGRWHEISWIKPYPDKIVAERTVAVAR